MEKNEKTREKESFFLLCVSSLLQKWPYLKKNSLNLNHTMKKNEQARSYGLTMHRGLHHGQSVVSSILVLFCYSVMLNFGIKWSKNLQNTEKNRT